MTTLDIVGEADARRLVTMADAIEVVERAFRALDSGTEAFPVVMSYGSNGASAVSVKSGVMAPGRLVGCKIGSYWPSNRDCGLANHGSTSLLLDDVAGFPRALVSAPHLTAMRTAAADGVALRALARADSSRLAIIGAGRQAWYEILAAREVRPAHVSVWNRTADRAQALVDRVGAERGITAQACSIEAAAADADIVVTVTASLEPVVQDECEWVRPGTISLRWAPMPAASRNSPWAWWLAPRALPTLSLSRQRSESSRQLPSRGACQ